MENNGEDVKVITQKMSAATEKVSDVEISHMKISDGRKKEKQRLWLKRPMTARLIFHGKHSEQKIVLLEGRAPAQATNDGTRLVKVRQAALSSYDLCFIDEVRPMVVPSLLGQEAVYEIVLDQCEEKIEIGTRLVINPFDPIKFGCTPLEAKGGRWAGAWSTHLLLTKDTFVLEIPKDISEFAACTCHTLALAYSACKRIIERDDPATIVVQGAGLLGLYCSAILSSHAFSVFVVDKSAKRLRMVTEFGGVPLHPSLVGPIESKANYVLECTGDPVAPEQAYTWLGKNSEYILLGLASSHEPIKISGFQLLEKNIEIRGVADYSNADLQIAVDFLIDKRGKYPWHKLTGPNFELAEWADAIETVRAGDYYRVLFRPETEVKERTAAKTAFLHDKNLLKDVINDEIPKNEPRKFELPKNNFQKGKLPRFEHAQSETNKSGEIQPRAKPRRDTQYPGRTPVLTEEIKFEKIKIEEIKFNTDDIPFSETSDQINL